MKFRMCRVEFAIFSMEDLRFLLKAWGKHLAETGQPVNRDIHVDVMLDDRVPGEQVCLCFIASSEVMDRFLVRLRQDGLKFSCDEIIPGLFSMCRVEHECF